MSPARRCSLAPAGRPPLKLIGAAASAAPGTATLAAHRRVSTRYPLSIVVSGAVLPPGHKSRSRCPLSVPLRSRMCCGCCGGSCCGAAVQKPRKIKTVAVFQFLREDESGPPKPGPSTQCHFLDTAGCGACGTAIALTKSRAQNDGGLMDGKVLSQGAYSAGDRSCWPNRSGSAPPITGWIQERI